MQAYADPVHQAVNIGKLFSGCQVIIFLRQSPYEMSCQKAVQGDRYVLTELLFDIFAEGRFPFRFLQHGRDLPVQRIIPVNRLIIILQHISADIKFIPVQQKPLAGLAYHCKPVGGYIGTQLFQITDQCRPAYIHFISQFVCQQRFRGTHQLAEHIIHPVLRRVEHSVRFTDPDIADPELIIIIDPETVFALFSGDYCAAFQISIQLFDIITDRSFTDAEFLRQRAYSQY